MQRFFPVLLAIIITATVSFAEDTPHHPLDTHLSETYTEDLPALRERKYIRVLTTMNRTSFFLAGGRAHGFEYELLKEYEKFLNKDIRSGELKITLEFIPVARDQLLPGLVEGQGDIAAAGLTITEKREKKVDFTRPYLTGVEELLVTHKSIAAPEHPEGLSGKQVFVRPSSSYYESLTALNEQLKKARKKPVKIMAADENLETEDILELVNTGAIRRTICDSHIARVWSTVLPDIRVNEDVKLRTGGRIAWAVPDDAPKLKESLNRFLQTHKKGTLLGNIFFNRYYKKTEWVKNPLKGDDRAKIKQYRPWFEKYAKQYGFDWRLLLAVAYQESGLNPDRKSHRGAVGLMQMLPSTAADPNVGINDIRRVENNIHAAAKYLDFIRDRYFSDPGISPRNRVRFALAAYNAGPARIRQARKKATAMNLDPDSWFRNVELAVLRMVGQETVRYVSNINKYYVIYKNALEREETRETVKERLN
ncbi:MAG: transporter substrate-binding domain-containing protein [Thermodesulfobacteriota bacterium]|nr:transporter substrate-binding domain-containing protein [Thermodesulfobacteriota bacterium]